MICTRCNKLLNTGDEAHIVDDDVFCSEACAVRHIMDEMIMNAKELAKEKYASDATILTVRSTTGKELCDVCSKDLASCETIWAAGGRLYCSHKCGVKDYTVGKDVEHAEHVFNMVAEEITPADIGLEVLDNE